MGGGGGQRGDTGKGECPGVGIEASQRIAGAVENLGRSSGQGQVGRVGHDAAVGGGKLQRAADGVGAAGKSAAAEVGEGSSSNTELAAFVDGQASRVGEAPDGGETRVACQSQASSIAVQVRQIVS